MTGFPLFGVASILLPVVGAIHASSNYARTKADTMGGAIGILIGAYLIFAVACGIGEVCAIVSYVRAERPRWIPVIGAILNLTVLLPPLHFALRK